MQETNYHGRKSRVVLVVILEDREDVTSEGTVLVFGNNHRHRDQMIIIIRIVTWSTSNGKRS